MKMQNKFQVDKINKITPELVRDACMYLLLAPTHKVGLLGVDCTDDIMLWKDTKSKAHIKLRIWSNMLQLHAENQDGGWIENCTLDHHYISWIICEIIDRVMRCKRLLQEPAMPRCKETLAKFDDLENQDINTAVFIYVLWRIYAEKSNCFAKDIREHFNLSTKEYQKIMKYHRNHHNLEYDKTKGYTVSGRCNNHYYNDMIFLTRYKHYLNNQGGQL